MIKSMIGKRLLDIGNCASGKTYLSRFISSQNDIPLLSLDDIYWRDDKYLRARSSKWTSNRVKEFMVKDSWIIEGIYSHLVKLALPSATVIIWLDLSYEICADNIENRGELSNKHTLPRMREYYVRNTGSSWASHNEIFQSFRGEKLKITSREKLSRLIEGNK